MTPEEAIATDFIAILRERDALRAENAKLRDALEASIAANELVLAQLRGGQDLTEAQVTKAMNAALAKARGTIREGKTE